MAEAALAYVESGWVISVWHAARPPTASSTPSSKSRASSMAWWRRRIRQRRAPEKHSIPVLELNSTGGTLLRCTWTARTNPPSTCTLLKAAAARDARENRRRGVKNSSASPTTQLVDVLGRFRCRSRLIPMALNSYVAREIIEARRPAGGAARGVDRRQR